MAKWGKERQLLIEKKEERPKQSAMMERVQANHQYYYKAVGARANSKQIQIRCM